MTTHVGNDIDTSINILEQYMRLIVVCLKPELDKNIFKIPTGRPSKNHINFRQ